MTVSVTTTVQQYTGTGANTVLNTVFPFFVSSDIVVTQRVTATGVDTQMVLGTHYTVSGGSSVGATGTVTPKKGSTDFTTAMTWTLRRSLPLTQGLDYVENDSFPAASHEAGLDRLTLQSQDRSAIIDRSLRFPEADSTALISELPSAVARASKALTFDSSGNPVATSPVDASGTSVTATGSTTARTLAERFAEVYNVRDYGAVGNGVTNDTGAIQSTIDAASSGGIVAFPSGTYITEPLFVTTDGISVVGSGVGVTILKLKASPSANQGALIKFGLNSDSVAVLAEDCSIRHLTIDGNKANQKRGSVSADGDGGNPGLGSHLVQRFTAEDLLIKDCDGYGVGLVGTNVAGRSDFRLKNIEIDNCEYDGLDIKGGDPNRPTRIWLENIYTHDHGPGNISSRDAVGVDLRGEYIFARGIHASGCSEPGIRTRSGDVGAYEVVLIDCVAENGLDNGFQIQAASGGTTTSRGVRLIGCGAYDNADSGFDVEASLATLVECHSTGNTNNGLDNGTSVTEITIIGGRYAENTQDGINIGQASILNIQGGAVIEKNTRYGVDADSKQLVIHGCVIRNNGDASTGDPGIIIDGTNSMSFWEILGCRIYDDQATKTQTYGIQFSDAPAAGVLTNNYFNGHKTGVVNGTVPSGTVRVDNIGYKTEAYGLFDFTSGASTRAVTHGLAATPGTVLVTPNEAWGAASEFRVHGLGGTTFSISFDTDPTSDVQFYWKAKV